MKPSKYSFQKSCKCVGFDTIGRPDGWCCYKGVHRHLKSSWRKRMEGQFYEMAGKGACPVIASTALVRSDSNTME